MKRKFGNTLATLVLTGTAVAGALSNYLVFNRLSDVSESLSEECPLLKRSQEIDARRNKILYLIQPNDFKKLALLSYNGLSSENVDKESESFALAKEYGSLETEFNSISKDPQVSLGRELISQINSYTPYSSSIYFGCFFSLGRGIRRMINTKDRSGLRPMKFSTVSK